MSFSFINIKDIFTSHIKVLRGGGFSNFVIFVLIPFFTAILAINLNYTRNNIDSNLSTALSIFIGLFINLLVLIVFVTRGFSKHKKEARINVIKELFYSITFVITISLFALVLILIKDIQPFPSDKILSLSFLDSISYNAIYLNLVKFAFAFLFTEIILTIILIIKRIFRLFDFDILEIKAKMLEENN